MRPTAEPWEDASEGAPDTDWSDLRPPRKGVALCLSGGGYRAMLFHAGALWRLNEVGYLPRLDLISSVSGGSITAAALAVAWDRLAFDGDGTAANFVDLVVEPLRSLSQKTIDVPAALLGLVSPGGPGARLAAAYDRNVLHGARLVDLPDESAPGVPRFVFNAANLQSAVNWRFSRTFMADYKVGFLPMPDLRLAEAVAASSAFPPVLSPLRLRVDPAAYDGEPSELSGAAFRSRVVLTDGGVYDNLGMEPAWKHYRTILVSDGGKKLKPQAKIIGPLHLLRVLGLLDNQVRRRRNYQLVTSFKLRRRLAQLGEHETRLFALVTRDGAYWHMADDLAKYDAPSSLPCPRAKTERLAEIPTRLAHMGVSTQEKLINFGYAACDTHLRTWVDPALASPAGFPYPDAGVG